MIKIKSIIISTIILIIISQNAVPIESAKILGIFALPQPARYTFMAAIVNALSERGHEITLVITYLNRESFNDNIRRIYIENEDDITKG